LENEDKTYSPAQVKRTYRGGVKKTTVFTFIDQIVTDLKKIDKIGNANMYSDCKRALSKFRNERDLNFTDIDVYFLKKFEQSLAERGVTGNTISVYMRSIRAVFNKAIVEGYCKKDSYPFDEYKISKLSTDTAKRAMTKEQMQIFISSKIKSDSELFLAKNIFLFSYYNRGINFTDIALLKWENVTNNRLVYTRAKTGRTYNISLLEPAVKILDHYRQFTGGKKDNYIFPLLDKIKHVSAQQIDNRVEKTNKMINKDLQNIAKDEKIDFHLTTYVARHSYATIMKRSGVSTSIISESLGHNSEKTTQIYLDSFENGVLDEANKAIL
jgi:site-specific recombinase XerD